MAAKKNKIVNFEGKGKIERKKKSAKEKMSKKEFKIYLSAVVGGASIQLAKFGRPVVGHFGGPSDKSPGGLPTVRLRARY